MESCLVFFDKVSRRPTGDIAAVNMAGCWQVADERVRSVSLACGGASPMPLRLTEVETALTGAAIEAGLEPSVEEALQTLVAPIDDVRGSADYRRLLLRQLLRSQWLALRDEWAGGEGYGGDNG
jgi:xanthine dehydrogenase small subunit